MFLYPLAIVLILLTLAGKLFGNDRTVLQWTIGFTAAASVLDLLRTLPQDIRTALHLDPFLAGAGRAVPLLRQGFGWALPALLGLAAGLLVHRWKSRKKPAA